MGVVLIFLEKVSANTLGFWQLCQNSINFYNINFFAKSKVNHSQFENTNKVPALQLLKINAFRLLEF